MKTYKHIGKIKNTGSKCLVVFRTLPGESNMSLILPTATLPDSYHNSIMELVETDQAQDVFEFAEIMFVRYFPDGRPMLRALQADNRLIKMPTDNIIMTPGPQSEIELSQLNTLIAEQRNCTIDDLCSFVKGGPGYPGPTSNLESTSVPAPVSPPAGAEVGILTDQDLAKSYRSQADAMYKEAARIRKEADSLDPPKKKSINPTDA
jgi:hypothetical protein